MIVSNEDLAEIIAQTIHAAMIEQEPKVLVEKDDDMEHITLEGEFNLLAIGLHIVKVLEG